MNKNILYILPRKDYFLYGNGGRVSHATGFITGLLENNARVTVISGDGLFTLFGHYRQEKKLTYLALWATRARFFAVAIGMWHTLRYISKNYNSYDLITIRYSAKLGWLFALSLFFLRVPNWGFEINSLAAHNLSGPRLAKISKFIENIFVRLAPVCNVVSPRIKKDIGGGDNVLVLPNGGPDQYLKKFVKVANEGPIGLYYFGKVKGYYDFDIVIELIKRRPDIHLYIAGEENSFLESLDNIHYLGEYRDIISLLGQITFRKHSITILPFRNGILSEIGSPTKMYEMLSMGLPILYRPNVGLLKSTLGDSRRGIAYTTSDELETMIDGIVTNLTQGDIITISEDQYYQEFTWTSRCRQYLKFIASQRKLKK